MSSWSSGYVADIDYTFGYYSELSPQRISLALLNAGIAPPKISAACELGFGQGLSVNIHGAAAPYPWFGTDFNPSQAAFARELASATSARITLNDDSFEDFLKQDLPKFDFIGLHGIWSWVSPQNRTRIVDFLKSQLNVGGVLYISYNTLPGWSTFAPLRHVMTQYPSSAGNGGKGTLGRIQESITFTEKLLAVEPLFSRANALASDKFAQVRNQDRKYLAHEYFNSEWEPMYFSSVARNLEEAKLTFACSANYIDHVDTVNLTSEQQSLLREISEPNFRETIRDFLVNQQFRKDYWVKGPRRLTQLEQSEALSSQRFVLITTKDEITLKVKGAVGEANLAENIYIPFIDLMSDHKSRTLGEIAARMDSEGLTIFQLAQAALILCEKGALSAANDDQIVAQVKAQTDKLNAHLISKARANGELNYLSSPVTGAGTVVNRFQQLFILAIKNGKERPSDWAEFVLKTLNAQGQKIVKDGKALESDNDQLSELTNQASEFEVKQLPILKALQIV